MDTRSAEEHANRTPLHSSVSRRDFLTGAAACIATSPALLRAAIHPPDSPALLHLASRNGYVHTYALTSGGCTLLAVTAIDSLAALAPHPLLPVLYVARDCRQWENLPRGLIETYAVEGNMPPLRLLARTPMALSATGPRSLAVSSCGRHLLVAASTGGAWNAFALDPDGVPVGLAIARKETGTMLNSHTVSLPTPHGLAISPHAPLAIGTDPGSGRMALLQPSWEAIAVLARHRTAYGLTTGSPVWTSDGRFVIAVDARSASLSIYEITLTSGNESRAGIHLLGTTPTATPITVLAAHPAQPAVFTSRRQGNGSRLELWKVHGTDLQLISDTWVSGQVVALAENAGDLWVASEDRLIRIPSADLRTPSPFEIPLPMRGVHAIVTQNLATRRTRHVGAGENCPTASLEPRPSPSYG